jgi:hypothetical protein
VKRSHARTARRTGIPRAASRSKRRKAANNGGLQTERQKWWYKFHWNGEPIRESTKQTNKRVAEQMEAAHKTSLAKREVGIHDKKPVPTLAQFADNDFLPFVRSTSENKPTPFVMRTAVGGDSIQS